MTAPPQRAELTSQQWSMTVTPVVAALTTLCAATALAGVIEGTRWLGYAGVAVIVVTATGLGLRAIRTPVPGVALGQMFAVLCLLVALFTNHGILGLLPGPAALSELGDVLQRSVEVVRTGVPPVDATAAVLCLVVIAIGLVAVLVDTLAVAAGAPAACGLVLLCVYAVPASLANEMLPWWSFVLGAGSFALLLAVDGAHRHQQWRNRPAMPGTGAGIGSPLAHVTSALLLALIAGATITAIGTVGQLPGGSGGSGAGGLGLKPFTSLRGYLDRGNNQELFRVRGLGQETRYLRAMTLSVYDQSGGWRLPDEMPSGVSTGRQLPLPPGSRTPRRTTTVDVEPVSNANELFAGVYGIPTRVRGLQGMRYDAESGMVFSENGRRLPRYTQEVDLTLPTADELKAAGTDYSSIDPVYLTNDRIDQRVRQLAREITVNRETPYDMAVALDRYFDGNDFRYSFETAPGNDEDALVDFLFRSKVGYCEQYASAMAILARAAGLPARVAVGYTAGFVSGDHRLITMQDAHAWVEIYFPGQGWVMFDPTPLADGRTFTPPYAVPSEASAPTDDPTVETTTTDSPATPSAPNQRPDPLDPGAGEVPQAAPEQSKPAWIGWSTGAVALLALLLSVLAMLAGGGWLLPGRFTAYRRVLIPVAIVSWLVAVVLAAALVSWWLSALIVVLTLAASAGFVREWRRRSRRHTIHRNPELAASAAWAELLAESVDRGAEVINAETVRMTARRLAREHELDEDGKRALRTVVSAVERAWYSGRNEPDPNLPAAFDELVAGIRRTSPLALRARLLPRSVLVRRPRTNGSDT